eukprot:SAG31_NODE_347_length_17310_cov_3.764743_13_plen_220_part_00
MPCSSPLLLPPPQPPQPPPQLQPWPVGAACWEVAACWAAEAWQQQWWTPLKRFRQSYWARAPSADPIRFAVAFHQTGEAQLLHLQRPPPRACVPPAAAEAAAAAVEAFPWESPPAAAEAGLVQPAAAEAGLVVRADARVDLLCLAYRVRRCSLPSRRQRLGLQVLAAQPRGSCPTGRRQTRPAAPWTSFTEGTTAVSQNRIQVCDCPGRAYPAVAAHAT